jgi:hypothetical protein
MRKQSYAVQFTLKSTNTKTGPIPVSTTSNETCPPDCPLQGLGCYAENGPLGAIWRGLSKAGPGGQFKNGRNTLIALTWMQFINGVATLPDETLWRHNQAGDLPGKGNAIDGVALNQLVQANKGKRGFTYTHKPIDNEHNRDAIEAANKQGFTINLSADNMSEADQLADANIAPVVVVLPEDMGRKSKGGEWLETEDEYKVRVDIHNIRTPDGRNVAPCIATYRDDASCLTCKLCERRERKVIVGFPAHGASRKRASAIAQG